MKRITRLFAAAALMVVLAACVPHPSIAGDKLTMVVMDPLSVPLSCDCVEGYAQRKYELLGRFLSSQLDREVNVVWNESLEQAVKETQGAADIVIGKHSVVLHDAKRLRRKMVPIASLSGREGKLTQRGLIVVRTDDRAKTTSDLSGYRIFFGPEEAAEKSAAPMELLKESGVSLPSKLERYGACSEAAVALLEIPADVDACAVISSYAAPLLEGCGSVKKGDLRVVGKTKEIPFVTAFVPRSMEAELRQQVEESLLLVGTNAELLIGLETLTGFEPWDGQGAAGEGLVKKK